VKNMLRFDVAYVALVAGTTFAFYGPPLSRYLSDRVKDYKGARRCVNGTDRDDEFARDCPKIERALERAIAAGLDDSTPLAATQSSSVVSGGGESDASTLDPATPEASGPLPDAPTVAVVNMAPVAEPLAPVETSAVAQPQAVEGGAAGDPLQKVTAGSSSWARQILAWISTLFGAASGYVRDAFGLTPEIQRWLLAGVVVVGVVWLVAKFFAERQVRELASDPTRISVK
jgi:hypothetical protein